MNGQFTLSIELHPVPFRLQEAVLHVSQSAIQVIVNYVFDIHIGDVLDKK